MFNEKNNILYLDDEKINLIPFNESFKDDYNIFLAYNRNEALKILEENEIKVLITDQRMPDISGIDFIKEINTVNKDIVCIILTAHPDNESLLSAINQVNVFRFLVKPWKNYDVKQTINSAIEAFDAKIEKHQFIKDLTKALQKAEEYDRLKSSFLANLSHEIRTPLNSIIGFTSLLANKSVDKNTKKEFEKIIHNSGNQLINVIEDMLTASQIETGVSKISDSIFCLNDFLQSIYNNYKQSALEKKIKLYIKGFDEHKQLFIKTDKTKLHEVFNQLLRNAIKYTDSGSIEFGISEKNDKVFFVKDTGTGIVKNEQEIIFEFFRQKFEKLNTRLYGGNGLGLSIVKGFVSMVGGEIWLDSEPGKGSTFFFNFPYTLMTNNKKFSDKNILVIANDEITHFYIQEFLQYIKVNLFRTCKGKEAIEYCKTNHVDLVIMDIEILEMNGFEAAKLIKANKPDLPIIALTAYDKFKDKSNGIFNDYVIKPAKKEKLECIKTHLFK